ncbi:alpha/beta hydrolase family esterase [Nocardia vaccinii]|uniref:alpha/beta hydrolase family esterase n=1 Tax=Nocardia vaccinii TaxID=1822 RepID=UPI000835ABD8|nr:PHB depolymerase family esterase [Nocardia vaccinii]
MSVPWTVRAAAAAAVASLITVAGCAVDPGQSWTPAASTATVVPAGSSTHTITVGGRVRTYHLYRPATVSGPAPLVVMLHGGFGTGSQAEASYGWDRHADSARFLVAYPDGLARAWNTGGGCCGIPARDGVDDVGFLTAMVRQIENSTAIDTARVYATGISNGGIMAYTLACRSDVFAAIGPDSATMLGACDDPRPLSVLHVHGTADHNIPYSGGPGQGPARIDGPAVQAVAATWRRVDGCSAPTVTTRPPVTTSTASCAAGKAVELITIDGAGHQWPGGQPNTPAENLLRLDPPSTALDATAVIWQFFATHPK